MTNRRFFVVEYVSMTAAEYNDFAVVKGSRGVPQTGKIVGHAEITPLQRLHVK